MKKRNKYIITIGVMAVMMAAGTGLLWAAGEPGSFLYWGTGARSMGMGNAYTGVVDDVYGVYWNAAALGRLEQKEIGTFYSALWEDTSFSFLAYAHPMIDKGAFGLQYIQLTSVNADKRDEDNISIGTFDHQQTALGISYGRKVYENLYWGFSGRYLSTQLDVYSRAGFTADTSFFASLNRFVTVGVNVQNIIAGTFGSTDDKLPIVARAGLGYKVLEDRFLIAMDVSRRSETGRIFDQYALGFEGKLHRRIALRIGRNTEEITFGIGLNYGAFNLDYAMATHYLGPSHRMSFNMKFGTPLEEIRRRRAEMLKILLAEKTETVETETTDERSERMKKFKEAYEEAMRFYQAGKYEEAHEKFVLANELDPTDPNVGIKLERIETIASIYKELSKDDKISKLVNRSIRYFFDGNSDSAVRVAAYAAVQKANDINIARLKAKFEEKTGIRIEYALPVSGRTIIDQKMHEALIAFHRKDYAKVIELCEEVIVLEPSTALAYKRLGSALYALGEKKKAISTWKEALKLGADAELEKIIRELNK